MKGAAVKSRIMYIECKDGAITGPARIGRVTFSQTGKTIYYRGRAFRSLGGQAYKANYCDTETGVTYWISGCKKNGNDTLYSGVVEVDEDVREEYWREIRRQPESVKRASFRAKGLYTKSGPRK